MMDKPEGKTPSSGGDSITVGDISDATGVAIGRGASATVMQHSSETAAMAAAFRKLHEALTQLPDSPKKTLAEQAVKGLEKEAKKGEKADEATVEGWFTSLMAMLPDIGEVAITTFINPISGLSTVFQKIAKKAKETQATG
jgi:hypothetical protein